MSHFLAIVSSTYDLVFKTSYSSSHKQYLTMLLIAHSTVDLLPLLKREDYYFTVDRHYCWNVSVLFARTGYVLIFVHSESETRAFLTE
ncbi:hypothetical protein COBT_002360, partial [Conglomerata obtusa]